MSKKKILVLNNTDKSMSPTVSTDAFSLYSHTGLRDPTVHKDGHAPCFSCHTQLTFNTLWTV